MRGAPAPGDDGAPASPKEDAGASGSFVVQLRAVHLSMVEAVLGGDIDDFIKAFLLLGATFITTGLTWCLVLAVAAARCRELLLNRPTMGGLLSRAAGAIFIALGLRLALHRP